jgi:hypothetical protein
LSGRRKIDALDPDAQVLERFDKTLYAACEWSS